VEEANDPEGDGVRPAIPRIYSLNDAATALGVRPQWLRTQLAARRFSALKRGSRWAMTEGQILAAIESMTVPARGPEERGPEESAPYGIARGSWRYWQRYGSSGNPNRRGPRGARPAVAPRPEVGPAPSWYRKVEPASSDEISGLPELSKTQLQLLERVRAEGEVVVDGQRRRSVEALVRRGLVAYEVNHVLNANQDGYIYRFTLRPVD